jgi:hypothetical protein
VDFTGLHGVTSQKTALFILLTKFDVLSTNAWLVNPLKIEFLHNLYTYSVRTSQETHYVSNTTPNRLMLFGETVAVYCENHMEHTDTLYGQNAEF